MDFDIAFSYASEQIEIVNKFKQKLTSLGLNVFLDTEHPELFVFNNVPEVLKSVYDDENTAMLIFLSNDYIKKNFTKFEGHIALDRLLEGKKISIIRIDDSGLPWLPSSHHFFDIRKNDINFICNAISSALKKSNSPLDTEKVFVALNMHLNKEENFIEDQEIKSCYIYKVSSKTNSRLKINYCPKQNKIAIYFYSIDVEPLFPIAEISTLDNSYILFNRGISNDLSLTSNYKCEGELLETLIKSLNEFVVKI